MHTKTKSRRGFASMSPEERSRIAGMGGKAAHVAGTAHEFAPEEARLAGRKGGAASRAKREAKLEASQDPAPAAV